MSQDDNHDMLIDTQSGIDFQMLINQHLCSHSILNMFRVDEK